MARHIRPSLMVTCLTLIVCSAMGAAAASAQSPPAATCEVKLASEIERADAQAYLIRLELAATKRQLAAALAKCGDACVEKKP